MPTDKRGGHGLLYDEGDVVNQNIGANERRHYIQQFGVGGELQRRFERGVHFIDVMQGTPEEAVGWLVDECKRYKGKEE